MPPGMLEPVKRMPPPAGDPFYIGTRTVIHRDPEGAIVHTEYLPLSEKDFLHPQEEDRFMLNDLHFSLWLYLCHALMYGCRERPKVKVFGDHRIDWQHEGIEPHGPDVAVFDRFDAKPEAYFGTLPVKDVGAEIVAVFEVTSEGTRHVDFGPKFEEYAAVGVPYYIVVDAAAPNGQPDVLGFRLSHGEYKLMRRDRELGYLVPGLMLWFRMEGNRLIVADEDGKDIPDSRELAIQLDSEKARAESEKTRADALAAELAAIKASLSGTPPKE